MVTAASTQWPRYEVFKQDAAGLPHQSVGSVHAPDAEMALLNARDVCGRRPSCHSIWVAREDAILSRTAEELAATPLSAATQQSTCLYEVFAKWTHRRAMTFVEWVQQVEAPSPEAALATALAQTPRAALAWWVVRSDAIARTGDDAAPSWFDPALDKTYRQQSYYGSGRVNRKS